MIVEKLGSTAMIIFWIYFAAMIGIGIYCRKYSTDFNGFMVGKRDLGPWYLGCAFFSTYLSSSVLIGNCGTAYFNGMSYMWNTVAQVLCKIGRASVGKECPVLCRSRWSPYH